MKRRLTPNKGSVGMLLLSSVTHPKPAVAKVLGNTGEMRERMESDQLWRTIAHICLSLAQHSWDIFISQLQKHCVFSLRVYTDIENPSPGFWVGKQ